MLGVLAIEFFKPSTKEINNGWNKKSLNNIR